MNGTEIFAVETYQLIFMEDWLHPLDELTLARSKRLRAVMMTWLSIALTLGIPGNFMVIGSIIFVKPLKQLHHAFLILLATCDLGVMAMQCFQLLGTIFGDTFLPQHPVLCELSGMVCMTSCFGSLWTMMFIAINRYLFVCKNDVYRKVFTKHGTILSIILIVFCVFTLDLPNWKMFGEAGHAFFDLYLHCAFDLSRAWWFNTIFYSGLAVGCPVLVVLVCYSHIWRTASKTSAVKSGVSGGRRHREQKQLLVSLITIFVTFVITWGPYGILLFFYGIKYQFRDVVAIEVGLIMDLWAHSNSAINFLIYGITHSGFRRAYKSLFAKLLPCICKIDPVNNHAFSQSKTNAN
ncbi:melatonin receptor type 1B-A-like [Convolutriloba macropyga]|uniref:melatonin receptor type 1B-A-like n=1 Tax=Convolutriloba macropyga TaxID=536237 RepID=UPI003F521F87